MTSFEKCYRAHVVSELMEFWKKWKRGQILRSAFALLFLLFLISCILIVLITGLPQAAPPSHESVLTSRNRLGETKLGELGLLMISMLPDKLAFTVFAPSEEIIEHVLKLQSNRSLMNDKINDTFAILSRTMGFCTVPKHVPSEAVPLMQVISLDSVSGFRIYVWKASDGTLIANNIRSEKVDLRKGEIIVHLMKGVIIDAEFEQAFLPDYKE